MQWTGWYRLKAGAPWRRACTGATLSECSARLNAVTRGLKLKSSNYIMTGGNPPFERPAVAGPAAVNDPEVGK